MRRVPKCRWEPLCWSRIIVAGGILVEAFLTMPAVAAQVPGGEPPPVAAPVATVVTATRVTAPPVLDGRADDAAWREAIPVDDFRVFSPREGALPTFRTELRVAYDDRALYVLVRAFDPQPDSIVRLLARRDTDGSPNDQVQLFIDSFHDRRNGYEYIVNAAGVKSDYLLFDDSGFDQSWDGIWDVATSIDDQGWVAEFAIPFQQLRFSDRRAPTFGIMLWRLVGRHGERVSWPAYRPSAAGLVSQAGTLVGIADLSRDAGIEIAPYLLGRARNSADASGEVRVRPAVGADLKFLPRPSISIDATVNPDFGQIEADPGVLDLGPVEVQQAERRPFFLEGAGLLNFPLAADGSALLFYSRRIGRRPALLDAYGGVDTPTETAIHGAGKVTARLAPGTSLAVLSAVVEPRTHYGVARLQRDFRQGRSGVGLMITRVDRWQGDSLTAAVLPSAAQAAALTVQHQTSDGAYQLSAWGATSDVQGSASAISNLQLSPVHAFQRPDGKLAFDPLRRSLRGTAGSISAGKIGGGIMRLNTTYRWISPGFDVNDLGYLTRADLQSWSAELGLKLSRPGALLGVPFHSASASLGFNADWTTTGLPHGRGFTLNGGVQLPNQMQLQSSVLLQLPGAYCSVICTRGGPALVDPPRQRVTIDVTGDPRRALIPRLNLEWNRDDEGRSHGLGGQADLTWRVRSNLETSLAAYAFDAHYDWFFYQRFGSPLSDTTHYTVATLDQPTRSLTARIDYTITRTLSVQWYAEAFLSRGTYTNVRELADPRAHDYERRFRPYGDDAVTARPGGIDFKQFRSNAVVRWEFRPGSTVFLVWSQQRGRSDDTHGALHLGPELRELFGIRPSNTIALKASYWLGR